MQQSYAIVTQQLQKFPTRGNLCEFCKIYTFALFSQLNFRAPRERAFAKSDAEFKELFGVKKETLNQMAEVLAAAHQKRHENGGRPSKLSIDDQLFLTLQYLREYRTMKHIAYDFGVAKSTVSDTIVMVENILIQDERFHLPGKKALWDKENEGRTFAVDATESPVDRPKKKQKKYYSGKKKRHTIKTQIVIDVETQEIICTDQEPGSVHDFQIFKLTIIAIFCGILLLADSGYQLKQSTVFVFLTRNTQKNGRLGRIVEVKFFRKDFSVFPYFRVVRVENSEG